MGVPMKTCEGCGEPFERPYRYSDRAWEERRFCSPVCAGNAKVRKPLCACGCGQRVARHGRRFVSHHGNRFQHGPQPRFDAHKGRWVVTARDGTTELWYRVVMANIVGRPLRPEEVVHHKNENPADDRPENLRLYPSHAEHMRYEHPTVGCSSSAR